jgi:ADP-ribose pyrophosphatase YjhB (NUDIX family)
LIDALVQIAITETSIQPLWEGLARREWREPQLAKFEVALAKLNFVAGMARTLRFERAYSLAMMDLWRTRPGALAVASGGQEPGEQPKTPRIPSGWVRLNQVEIARMFQDFLIPVFNTNQMMIDLRLADRLQVQADERLKGWSPYKALARMLLPAVSKASQRAATAQTTVNLARIAVALERFRLANGSYPEQLAALAPGYLPEVPHEAFSGKPYQYRREASERFQLYSVGLNMEDDGGRVAVSKDGRPNSRAAGADWVWQYSPVTNRVIITGTAGM